MNISYLKSNSYLFAMRSTIYLTLLILTIMQLPVSTLSAQDSTRTANRPVDQGTQMMIERSNLDRQLIFGGFVVNNPEIDYEIDEDKLYIDPVLRPCIITLVGGLTDTLPARIQLYDQLVEVVMDGKDMQVASKYLKSVVTQEGREFVAFRQPLLINQPPPLLELLGTYENYRLYGYRRVELREPSHKKTPYDAGSYKKRLHREDLIYVIASSKTTQIRKVKDLIALLPDEVQIETSQYVKQEGLRNREEDYIKLLVYLNRLGR